jgi:hypothetical protein
MEELSDESSGFISKLMKNAHNLGKMKKYMRSISRRTKSRKLQIDIFIRFLSKK